MATPEHPKALLKDMKAVITAKPDRLTEWERKFSLELKERVDKFGDGVYLSEKQAAIITRIAAELRGEKTARPAKRSASADLSDEAVGDMPELGDAPADSDFS